jgi:hypothetical protein
MICKFSAKINKMQHVSGKSLNIATHLSLKWKNNSCKLFLTWWGNVALWALYVRFISSTATLRDWLYFERIHPNSSVAK